MARVLELVADFRQSDFVNTRPKAREDFILSTNWDTGLNINYFSNERVGKTEMLRARAAREIDPDWRHAVNQKNAGEIQMPLENAVLQKEFEEGLKKLSAEIGGVVTENNWEGEEFKEELIAQKTVGKM